LIFQVSNVTWPEAIHLGKRQQIGWSSARDLTTTGTQLTGCRIALVLADRLLRVRYAAAGVRAACTSINWKAIEPRREERAPMGYLDALTSRAFKTMPDGRKVFFPLGVLVRGYVVGSERDYERLRRQYTILFIAVVLPIGAVIAHEYVAALILMVAYCAIYFAWMWHVLRGLQRSDERLSLREQARTSNPVVLWAGLIVSIGFVVLGFLILMADLGKWLAAVPAIVLFGLCACVFVFMLENRARTPG
jgi:hypothetical protein